MSSLSELFPSGGGSKEFTATATGAITSGEAVVVNSDGTVSTVSEFGNAASNPANANVGSDVPYYVDSLYIASLKQYVVVYTKESSPYNATIACYDVSDSAFTFVNSISVSSNSAATPNITHNPNNDQMVLIYQDEDNSGYPTVATYQASAAGVYQITAPTVIQSAHSIYTTVKYEPTSDRYVAFWTYDAGGTASEGRAVSFKDNYGSYSFGAVTTVDSRWPRFNKSWYDPNSQSVVISYSDAEDNPDYLYLMRIKTNLSTFGIDTTTRIAAGGDGRSYSGVSIPGYPYFFIARPGNVVNTIIVKAFNFNGAMFLPQYEASIYQETAVPVALNPTAIWDITYDERTKRLIIPYRSYELSYRHPIRLLTVTFDQDGVVTFDSDIDISRAKTSHGTSNQVTSCAYDSYYGNVLLFQQSSSAAEIEIRRIANSNNVDIAGVAAEDIADGASGLIIPMGGATTNSTANPGQNQYATVEGVISNSTASQPPLSVKVGNAISSTSILLSGE